MLKRQYRLKKNGDFKRVYENKNSVAAGSVVLYIKCNEKAALPRVGFSVSKRIGNAVVRNRLRRKLREAVRQRLSMLKPGWDYVFIVRQSMLKSSWEDICRDVGRALQRINGIQR